MAVRINEDAEFVQEMRKALEKSKGFCPCVLNPKEDDRCICKDFRDKLADKEYEGWCNCRLYFKVKG